jgi:hypothetical protein
MKTLTSETNKLARGQKHTCTVCEVRFYDLQRSQIICPACSSPFTPPAPRVAPPRAAKSRWRDQFERHNPVPSVLVREAEKPDEDASESARDDETAGPDDSVPEEVQDEDDDMTDVIDVSKTEER